jgi:hypothetical protein
MTTRRKRCLIRRFVPVIGCLLLTACNGGTVDRHALSNDSDAIDSLACEGAFLAGDVADGDSTASFARVHAGELARRASNFEDALSERPTVSGIEREVRALARRAGRIAALLESLNREPSDRDTARRLETELSSAGDCP